MKSIFTSLILTLFSMGMFAQNSNNPTQKNDVISSGILSEQQSFSIVNVYPNPVKDFATIDIQSKNSEPVQIRLYNILGTEVKKWDSNTLRQGTQKLKLDLSAYKSGVYIIRISGTGQVCSQVIKKN